MHSDHAAGCKHTGIAHNTVGDVSICAECNIVHLTLSHMTLRLTPEAFRSLSDLVSLSQFRLEKAQQSVKPRQAAKGQDAGTKQEAGKVREAGNARDTAHVRDSAKAPEPAPFPLINTPQRLH